MYAVKSKKLLYTAKIADIFGSHGSTALRVDEIANILGVATKTLYKYFESKQGILECVTDYLCRTHIERINEGLLQQKNPIDALNFICRSLISFSEKYAFLFKINNSLSRILLLENLFDDRENVIVEIVEFCFKKGAHEGYFEQDIDHKSLSLYFLFQLKFLFNDGNRLLSNGIDRSLFLHGLYFYLKGMCTEKGLVALRSTFDIKVVLR